MGDYLHRHPEFADLLRIVGEEMGILPALVEKDYWIMHCLFGLKLAGYSFELKGGTSLSKGFGIIDRFSEDIDLRINPPEGMAVAVGRNQDKPKQIESRQNFYDRLAEEISIDGIISVERDHVFDDEKFRSGGIRLHYPTATSDETDLNEGVLLELGFDDVTPNRPVDISSWAYEFAFDKVDIADNRALGIVCYHPGYTLVEKLQTISTKFRKQHETGEFPANFLRHYYDVYALLGNTEVLEFLGSDSYFAHKKKRFRSEERDLTVNPAFNVTDEAVSAEYQAAYRSTRSLYYRERPTFEKIIERIREFATKL